MKFFLAGIIAFLSGGGVSAVVSYVKWIYPRRRAEEAAAKERLIIWDGDPGIPGARPPLAAMPLRVDGVEKGLTKVSTSVDALTQRMHEANGTSKRIEGKVDTISTLVTSLGEGVLKNQEVVIDTTVKMQELQNTVLRNTTKIDDLVRGNERRQRELLAQVKSGAESVAAVSTRNTQTITAALHEQT